MAYIKIILKNHARSYYRLGIIIEKIRYHMFYSPLITRMTSVATTTKLVDFYRKTFSRRTSADQDDLVFFTTFGY